jgi:tungstate transport system permease protein
VSFLWQMLEQALTRIGDADATLLATTWRTLRLAFGATFVALLVGLPLGVAIAQARRPRWRRAGFVLANAGLGLPPVVLGVFLALVLLPGSPLGGLHLTNTLWGVFLAQVLLALPIVVALSAVAVAGLPAGLLDQARAFGAGPVARGALALREAWVGVLVAVIAALGSAVAEVGAVVIVGGNLQERTSTLASQVLLDLSAADPAGATADVLVLLAIVALLGVLLTLVQQRARRVA